MASSLIKGARLELFLTDLHGSSMDPQAWDLVMQLARGFDFDLVWCNGDWVDFKAVSSFSKTLKDKLGLTKDLAAAQDTLRQLRKACPNAEIHFREGNHDRRLYNMLLTHADALTELPELSIPELLHFGQYGVIWHPGDEKTQVGRLYHLHGDEVRASGTHPARKVMQKVHDNVVVGHIHKFDVCHETNLAGDTVVAWTIGTLQRLDVDYDFHPQWDQGCAIINYTQSGNFHIDPIVFFNIGGQKSCMVNGKLFTAKASSSKK